MEKERKFRNLHDPYHENRPDGPFSTLLDLDIPKNPDRYQDDDKVGENVDEPIGDINCFLVLRFSKDSSTPRSAADLVVTASGGEVPWPWWRTLDAVDDNSDSTPDSKKQHEKPEKPLGRSRWCQSQENEDQRDLC